MAYYPEGMADQYIPKPRCNGNRLISFGRNARGAHPGRPRARICDSEHNLDCRPQWDSRCYPAREEGAIESAREPSAISP